MKRTWMLAVALAAAGAAVTAWLLKPAVPALPRGMTHFSIDLPAGAQLDGFGGPMLALSPDGRRLVYVARLDGTVRLFVRDLDQLTSKVLAETDGPSSIFFSPDGHWVGMLDGSVLKKVPVGGGTPVTIATAPGGTGASWGPDDGIVFAPSNRKPLARVAASGGEPTAVTVLDRRRGESSHRWPEVLPGGRAIIFTAGPPSEGPWHEAEIVVQSLETGQRQPVIRGAAQAHYISTGHLAYTRAGTLYAVPFDANTLRVTGPPVALLENVRESPSQGASQFVVSANGTLAYVSGGLQATDIVLVTRRGEAKSLMPQERRLFDQPRLSPDARQVALTVGGGDDATFLYDLASQRLSRLTSGGNHLAPTWSADGKRVTTRRTVSEELVSSSVDRSGPQEILHSEPGATLIPASWSPDGRMLVFVRNGDIWRLTLPERRVAPMIESRYADLAPAISPDGRWLAYSSNESGRHEVYVQPFPDGGRRWQVSHAGGTEPVWARRSEELFFRQDAKLIAVRALPPFAKATELFEDPSALRLAGRPQYDVAPDGQGFLMVRSADREAPRLHVVLNWTEELKQRVPTR